MSDTKPKDGGMGILRDYLEQAAAMDRYHYPEPVFKPWSIGWPAIAATERRGKPFVGVDHGPDGETCTVKGRYLDGHWFIDEETHEAAECGKEGAMEWTDARLVEALKESAEWARARLDVAAIHRGIPDWQADHYIPGDMIRQKPDFLSHATQMALRELAESIRSGAIYGSAERCAVCGKSERTTRSNGYLRGEPTPFYRCEWCATPLAQAYSETKNTAAAILRARRLLGERKGKDNRDNGCWNCETLLRHGCKCSSGSDHYCDDWTLAGTSGEPQMEPTRKPWMGSPDHCAICGHGPAAPTYPFESLLCWGATGVRPESPTDMHVCENAWMEGCKSERTDDPRENERRVIVRAHEWYTEHAAKERPYAEQMLREASPGFKMWQTGQTGIATGVYMVSETTRERLRRMVREINWYEKNVEGKRGPDPRLLLMGDVFDPSRRAR